MNKYPKLIAGIISCVGLSAQSLDLSIDQAIAAALEKNFAIKIQQLEPRIADEELRGAKGKYDPVIESAYTYSNEELFSINRDQESASFRFGVATELPWGTRVAASVETRDTTSPLDPLTEEYIPRVFTSVTSFSGITVTQPILRGFGLDSNHASVRIAEESSKLAWESFRAEVMNTVEATVQAFQSLYFAQENLRIAMRNRDLAQQLLEDNRKRVETGAMAPLDIVQAESEAALREVSVISAKASLRRAINGLKALIWDDPQSVLDLELNILPPSEPALFEPDLDRDYALALESLPEYRTSQAGLNIREIQIRQFNRDALPQLDLIGSFGKRGGLGDPVSDRIGDAFDNGQASYTIGAVFSLPFPNRSLRAQKTQAYLRRNQSSLGLEQLKQSIRLELDNASTQLLADWERIQAARTARELSEKSLQAEEKKLRAGTSTTFVVLRLQGDLANAEIRETNALADYSVSLARYHRSRGRILEEFNVELADN